MFKNHGRFTGVYVRSFGWCAAFVATGCVLAGCGGPQVDKYTVTDADREAAKAAKSTGAAIPRDPHDGAAYGPDGKPIGSGGAKAP
jgi:hypothetical protein